MQSKQSDIEKIINQPQMFFIHSEYTVQLHPENEVSQEETSLYEAPADDGFAQNTTTWD